MSRCKRVGRLFIGAVLCAFALGCERDTTTHKIDKERAEQLALQELPGAYIVGETLERDLERLVFRVYLQNDSEARRVTIDVETGRLVEVKDATEKLIEAKASGEDVPEPISLTHRDAAEYAVLQAVPGTVRKWKAVRDSGRLVFKFSITQEGMQEKRVTVDARSQAILDTLTVALDNR